MNISTSIRTITPEQALAILGENAYQSQRGISKVTVAFLADEMKAGTFDQTSVIRMAMLGLNTYLIDGQHRLRALCDVGIPQRFVVVTEDFDTLDQIADAYTRIDQGRRRSVSDRYKTLDLVGKLRLPSTIISSLGAAVRTITGKFDSAPTLHQDEQLRLMTEYSNAARQYWDISQHMVQELQKPAFRSATFALALVTLRYSQEKYGGKVPEFWRGVLHMSWVSDDDARKYAYRHLTTSVMHASVAGGPVKLVRGGESSRILAAAFNSFVKDEPRKLVRMSDHQGPIRIEGTLFTGE